MPWPLYLALKQLFPTGRWFSFYSAISILGVMLGVMVLLIVQTVMNGFGDKIRENIVARDADIRIQGDILYQWKPLLEELAARKEIKAATPFAEGVVMVKRGNIPFMPYFRGVDVGLEGGVYPLAEFLKNVADAEGKAPVHDETGKLDGFQSFSMQCSLDDLDDETIILGRDLAANLNAFRGDTIEVFTPLMLEKAKRDEVLLPREFEVAGAFQSGWYEVDSNTAIVTLRAMQELYGLGRGVHGLALKLEKGHNAEKVARELEGVFKERHLPFHAVSWLKKNESFLFFLGMEKWVMFFIMIFIILVASFSIAVTLSVSVLRKTREIGLLCSIGARQAQIAQTFCLQSVAIGVIGVGMGIVGALLALYYRNRIVGMFLSIFHAQDAFYELYGFEGIPASYSVQDFVLVSIFTMVLTTMAGLLPAIRASRLKPAEALRSE